MHDGQHFGIDRLISLRQVSDRLQLLKNAVFVRKDRQSDLLPYLTVFPMAQEALKTFLNSICRIRRTLRHRRCQFILSILVPIATARLVHSLQKGDKDLQIAQRCAAKIKITILLNSKFHQVTHCQLLADALIPPISTTAPGPDEIPSIVFRKFAAALAQPVKRIWRICLKSCPTHRSSPLSPPL